MYFLFPSASLVHFVGLFIVGESETIKEKEGYFSHSSKKGNGDPIFSSFI